MHNRQPNLIARSRRHPSRICLAALLSLPLASCVNLRDREPALPGSRDPAIGSDNTRTRSTRPPHHEQVRKAAATMLEGISLYDDGDFNGAIARLGAPEFQTAPVEIQVEALKYTAFSYCVIESYAQCRHAFDLALRIDPDFMLQPGERAHPMWGSVFDQAKAASDQARVRTVSGRERERWRNVDPWRPK